MSTVLERRSLLRRDPAAVSTGLALAGCAASPAGGQSAQERSKAVNREYFSRCWDQADIDFADAIMVPDYNLHLAGGARGGVAQWKRGVAAFNKSFNDVWFENLQMVAEGDIVACRSGIHTTHVGEYCGVPATGKRISMRVADFYRLRDGKMVAHWDVPDFFSRLNQMGAVPESLSARALAFARRMADIP